MSEKNFGYLGTSFQQQLIKTIIEDKKFAVTIVESIDSKYFDGPYFKYLMENIKELYKAYGVIPDYTTLEQKILKENKDVSSRINIDTLHSIRDMEFNDAGFVRNTSLNFCRQQVLKKSLKEVEEIMNHGDFENYNKIEDIVQKALQVGASTNNIVDVCHNVMDSLMDESRVPFPTGITGIDNLLKGGLARGEFGLFIAPTGVGKELPISEPVLTPNGWTQNGSLQVGDRVIGSDGKEQYVLGVYPQGIKPIYRINFSDGTFVNCGLEHLWNVNTLNMRTAKTRKDGKGIYKPNNGYITLKTSDMIGNIKKRGRYNYRLPIVEPVEFNPKDVLIEPYFLGVLLGDGYLSDSGVRISTKDDEIFENIQYLNEHSSIKEYRRDNELSLKTIKTIYVKSSVKNKLRYYELLNKKSNNKFIPLDYLYNSADVRLKILQGLMDTDGYVSKSGRVQFSTVSRQLSEDVREIVLSLGGTVSVNQKTPAYNYKNEKRVGQLSYILTISFANNIVPFKMTRKVNRYYARKKYINQKYIDSIIYSHDEEALCIKVSNCDELYVTRDYVLTHNTTFLTKVANSAFNCGANVLQIFFEDNLNDIRRKHYTIWTGYNEDDQRANKEKVVEVVEKIGQRNNFLKLLKLPAYGVTVGDIKSQVRKLNSEGYKIDVLVIDYLECIAGEARAEGDEWKGEGTIVRSLESAKDEFNIAIWAGTQGNRDSIASEVVTTDQIGGSIKKAQVGHVVISAGKTLEQKEHNLATVTLLKSRIGKDGVVFTNCKFNNEYLDIDTETQTTLLGHEEEEAKRKSQRAADVYQKGKEKEREIIEASVNKILEDKISKMNNEHEPVQPPESVSEIGVIELKDDNTVVSDEPDNKVEPENELVLVESEPLVTESISSPPNVKSSTYDASRAAQIWRESQSRKNQK